MKHERRRYERFPLLLTGRHQPDSQNQPLLLEVLELGVGGCLIECFPEARAGYRFQLEIPYLDQGWLRLNCKVRYRFTDVGVGVEFRDISEAEKESLAEIIMTELWHQDLPPGAPFAAPSPIENPHELEFA